MDARYTRVALLVVEAALFIAIIAGIAWLGQRAFASRRATPTPTPVRTARAPLTPTGTAATTPAPARTPSPSPTSNAPAGGPPVGYAQSCASAYPWGQQVSRPFVCIDAPGAGTTVPRGSRLTVRGYAGGSFESHVNVEVRAVQPDGSLASTPLASAGMTYAAPDVGLPGPWETTFTIPGSAPAGKARVIAHFESPRDGSRVAEAAVDIVLQ